jgi:hypothetical protein
MDFVLSWIIVPLLVAVLATGVGLLLRRVTGVQPPGGLLLPVGFGGTLLLLSVPYALGFGTAVATPTLMLASAAGFWLERGRVRASLPDHWTGLAVLAAYGLYMAPVILSKQTTFAGYTFLGDNSVHFALADHVAEHGSHTIEQPPSSYATVVDALLRSGYPLGQHFLLASVRGVVGLDVAFIYQGFLTVPIALAVLPAAEILRRGALNRPIAACLAVVAVGAYLPYSYALQGGMKEMAMILFVLSAAVLADGWLLGRDTFGTAVLLGVVAAAAFSVYSFGALPWFGLMLGAVTVVGLVRERERRRRVALAATVCAVAFAVAGLPHIITTLQFLGPGGDLLSSSTGSAVGNLVGPIRLWQSFGVWLGGDYRVPPLSVGWTYALIGVVAVAVVTGLLTAARTRQTAVLLAACTCFAVWVILPAGVYIEAKLLAILSPAVLLLAFIGARTALGSAPRVQGVLVTVVVAFAVLYSDAHAYRSVYLAPVPRLKELAAIDQRFAGQGPAFLQEFEEYGKHFLRHIDVNAAYEAYTPLPAPTRSNEQVYARWVDLDKVELEFIERYRLLVQRRSPVASRPPANFELAFRGRFYDVWRRTSAFRVLDHVPAGDDADATGRTGCAETRPAAAAARRAEGELVLAERPNSVALPIRKMGYPLSWVLAPDGQVVPAGPGRITGRMRSDAGRYRFWIRGQFGRGLTLSVDRRRIGRATAVQTPGGMALVGTAQLKAGRHHVELVRPGGSLAPANARGEGYDALFVEPLEAPRLRTAPVTAAGRACRARVDWIEAVKRR